MPPFTSRGEFGNALIGQGLRGAVLAPSLVTTVVPSVPVMVTIWSLVAPNAVDVAAPFLRQLAGIAQVKLPFDQGEGQPELSAVSGTSLAGPYRGDPEHGW